MRAVILVAVVLLIYWASTGELMQAINQLLPAKGGGGGGSSGAG